VQRDTSLPSAPLAFFTLMMLLAPVTNWEPHGVKLAGYRYAMRYGMKVQILTPYGMSYLQRYGVTVRSNVTCVYLLLEALLLLVCMTSEVSERYIYRQFPIVKS
jgi:hypothetical protein